MRLQTAWRVAILFAFVLAQVTVGYANSPPAITHVWAAQRPGTQLVDVLYSVVDPDGDSLTMSLFLSLDGGQSFTVPCLSVTGDVGAGIRPGADRTVSWNAVRDAPGLAGSNYVLRVVADDVSSGPYGFVSIPAGTFNMGCPEDELGRGTSEVQHQVTLTHGFIIQATEVTNQQYMQMAQWAYNSGHVAATSAALTDGLDGSNAELLDLDSEGCEIDFGSGVFTCVNPDHPVQEVTWYGAAAYCDWLSLQQGRSRAYNHGTWQCNDGSPYAADGYRLPTEAEWEYACRASSTAAFANGPITYAGCSPLDPSLDQLGWYCGNADGWTHPVALKSANAWGLFDMHGNVLEWCNDWWSWWGSDAVTDPVGPGSGVSRVFRSGGWSSYAPNCRSAGRYNDPPGNSSANRGFRPVRSAE